jgi:hypothetical protein
MKDCASFSPLKVLQKASRKGLGRGNLGVLIARAGVGKTACLVRIGFDKLLRQERLVHISLEEGPDKIISFYDSVYRDLVKALELSDTSDLRVQLERNKMILAYLNRSFDVERLRVSLQNLAENMQFRPNIMIVDGLQFEHAEKALFQRFREIAQDLDMEIWFSALSHRHIKEVNTRGIPNPCQHVDEFFSVILQLQPESTGMLLKVLKDHEQPVPPDASVLLDPNSLSVRP